MNEKLEYPVSVLEKRKFVVNRVEEDCVYMMRKKGPSTFYAEVELNDGAVTVNGVSLSAFIADIG
jgi:hypothetical protein